MARFFVFCLSLLVTWLLPQILLAQSATPPSHISSNLIVPRTLARGDNDLGLELKIADGWRLVWSSEGAEQLSPKIEWESDSGSIEPLPLPIPNRVTTKTSEQLAYNSEIVFPFRVRPNDLSESLTLKGHFQWLICKEELCITETAELNSTMRVDALADWDPDLKTKLESAVSELPASDENSPWSFQGIRRLKGDEVEVRLTHNQGKSLENLDLMPLDSKSFTPQKARLNEATDALILKLNPGQKLGDSYRFYLSDETGSWDYRKVGTAPSGTTPRSIAENEAFDAMSFLLLLLSAFAGGMILNLMPCVLPVLSIKFFSLARMNQKTRWHEIWLYSLGVLTTFTLLGGVFLALRAGGSAVGWGFQLQSPPIVFALILLFWLMGLSFLGLFEFGNSLVQVAGRFHNSGAFATGILSVFVATPCTGPFMGTALGAAATLPALYALAIFFFLGLGLAAPFLLLAVFPNIRLPKPGAWMNTLRQFLAFPLFATVLWLSWVLGLQLGTDAWLYVAALCLLLAFVIWLGKDRPLSVKLLAWIIGVVGLVYSARWVYTAPKADKKIQTEQTLTHTKEWVDFDPKLIVAERGKRAIFVDFTAAWCVTCQVNKKAVLETEAANTIFAKNDVVLIRADWTNLDESITQALAEFDRASVPLYLFYPKDGGKPKILPQILTMAEIEALFP